VNLRLMQKETARHDRNDEQRGDRRGAKTRHSILGQKRNDQEFGMAPLERP
jgi:hypothetical protein